MYLTLQKLWILFGLVNKFIFVTDLLFNGTRVGVQR